MKITALVLCSFAGLLLSGCLKTMEDLASETKGSVQESLVTMKDMKELASKEGALELMRDPAGSPHIRFLGAWKLISDPKILKDADVHSVIGAMMPIWDYVEVPTLGNIPNVTVIAERQDVYLGRLTPVNMDTYLVLEAAVMKAITLIWSNLQTADHLRKPFPELAGYVRRLVYVAPTILGAREWNPETHSMTDHPVIEATEVRERNKALGFAVDPHLMNRYCAARDLMALMNVREIADLLPEDAPKHLQKVLDVKMAITGDDPSKCAEPTIFRN